MTVPQSRSQWLVEALQGAGDLCLLWPFPPASTGYGQLWHQGRVRSAHSVVMELTDRPRPTYPKPQVRHLCGVALCVNPSHLMWGTCLENAADRVAHGRALRGRDNPASKLTDVQVREIRASGESARSLARKYRVSHQAILDIRHGRTWAHLLGIGLDSADS